MDSQLSAEINKLKRQQKRAHDELHRLGDQCTRLNRDFEKLSVSDLDIQSSIEQLDDRIQSNQEKEVTAEVKSQTKPKTEPSLTQAIDKGRQKVEAATPPPLPPPREPKAELEIISPKQKPASGQAVKPTQPTPPTPKSSINAGEWELKFGQVWLVRIGVVFLLTGLIFLSTYAYKNWLFNTGPIVKVSFFMLISLALAGAGLWLENWKTRFIQYGRVLASGGLAAGYYTLYAAHFTPSLKVVNSPVFAGLLLTLWAGIMLAYAVWKKSRIVAVMAIGLAFYGTVINPAGALSLFSSLLLSSAGMWLLIKFRWVGVGFSTMIAAYVAHAFWLGYYPTPIDESLRLTYLACYWVLFTASLLVPQARTLALPIQRAFCALNNAAAWGLTVFLLPSFTPHLNIGWISIGMGTVWILFAVIIQRNPSQKGWHQSLAVIYGYQGILMLSLGILLEATGYTRFLILAVEACVLLAGARFFGGWLARIVSAAAFTCALLTALPLGDAPAWPSYSALALVCMTYTILVRKDKNQRWSDLALVPASATWMVLAWGVFQQWTPAYGVNGLWILATIIIIAYFTLKKPSWLEDLALISVPVTFLGGIWFLNLTHHPHWALSLCPVIGAGIYWYLSPLIHLAWDQRLDQTSTTNPSRLEWIFSGLMWCMLTITLEHHMSSESYWMLLGGTLALSGHALSHLTQRNSIGIPAVSLYVFALTHLLTSGSEYDWLGWAPAIFMFIHLTLVDGFWKSINPKILRPLLCLGLVFTTCIHACQTVDRPDLILTGLGIVLLAWAYVRKNLTFAKAGALPALVLACVISLSMHDSQDWGRYVPILTIMLAHGFLWLKTSQTHNSDGGDPWLATRAILLTAALLSLLIAVSLHVRVSFDGSGLSICWAIIAFLLFALGLIMRCRPYRLVGLTWLAAAVVHVIGVDVMRLGSLGRILSFITLGVVLLVLGFLYNRFQETIRKFL